MSNEKKIILDHVTCWHKYGKLSADRVCLTVAEAESVLVYGQSQDELSDLFKAVAGVVSPNEGTVSISGKKAVILEDFPYLEAMTVMDYMLLPAQLTGVPVVSARRRASQVLMDSPLIDKRSVRIDYLSYYERCLLCLSMSFMTGAEVLIMGDCMRVLNESEESSFWQYARAFIDKYGVTLLCFSGRPDNPYPFLRKYELKSGRLILQPHKTNDA